MEFHSVQARIFLGPDGIIGTDQSAHGAADAGVFNPGILPDTVKGVIVITMLGIFGHRRFYNPFLERMKGDGLDRTHSRALTAQGTRGLYYIQSARADHSGLKRKVQGFCLTTYIYLLPLRAYNGCIKVHGLNIHGFVSVRYNGVQSADLG